MKKSTKRAIGYTIMALLFCVHMALVTCVIEHGTPMFIPMVEYTLVWFFSIAVFYFIGYSVYSLIK